MDTTTSPAAETLTDSMIRSLRSEAASAGDLVVMHAADLVLLTEDPITTEDEWEERYGGGGHYQQEHDAVLAMRTIDDAMAILRDAIEDAAAMDENLTDAETLIAESEAHGRIARAEWTPELHAALVARADDHTDTDEGHDYWACESDTSDRMTWRVELVRDGSDE